MVKKEFVEELGAELGVTVTVADDILKTVTSMVYKKLASGDTVQWSGFGTFSVSHRKARMGVYPRNPSKPLLIQELNTPKFKAGEAFKAAVKLKK